VGAEALKQNQRGPLVAVRLTAPATFSPRLPSPCRPPSPPLASARSSCSKSRPPPARTASPARQWPHRWVVPARLRGPRGRCRLLLRAHRRPGTALPPRVRRPPSAV